MARAWRPDLAGDLEESVPQDQGLAAAELETIRVGEVDGDQVEQVLDMTFGVGAQEIREAGVAGHDDRGLAVLVELEPAAALGLYPGQPRHAAAEPKFWRKLRPKLTDVGKFWIS